MSEQGTVHKPAPKNSTIPVKLLHDPNAKDGTIRLYAHMYWRYGQNKKNYEGQKSMAGYLRVTSATISKRVKELEYLDWLVVVERDFNPNTGNYTTPFYHLFLSQTDCRKFRAEYVAQEGERMRPKLAADEVELRISRAGKGNPNPKRPTIDHANSGSDGQPNLSSDGHANSGSDKLIPSYPGADVYTSSKDSAPPENGAGSIEADSTVPPVNGDKPKTERPRNEWYDVIAETFKAEGWRNGKIQNILRGVAKGNEAKFNLEIPLTDVQQVRDFWTWYQKICPGCSLADSAATQDYVMRWQREGSKPKQPAEFARHINWVE